MDLVGHPFFNKRPVLSYSGLNKLLFSPLLYRKHYIENEREDKLEPHLIEGKLIHLLLLEKDKLPDKFIVSPSKIPTANTAKLLYKISSELPAEASSDLNSHKDLVLKALADVNLHQSLKTDEQRLDKIIDDLSIEYFRYLRESDGKDVVDEDTYLKCKQYAEIIQEAPEVMTLLHLGDNTFDITSDSECYMKAALPDYNFDLHGFIDNYVIRHNSKRIVINDIKTTGKPIQKFQDTVEYYRYDLQAAVYIKLIKENYPQLIDYEVEYNFIVIDNYAQVCIFTYSHDKCLQLTEDLVTTLQNVEYHFVNRKFDLPYDVKEGRVYL